MANSFFFAVLVVKMLGAATVTLRPGDDIQAAVRTQPPGTTYVLRPGTYRMQSVTPQDGDVFHGEKGAILNGSRLLTAFTREGPCWVAAGQTQEGPVKDAPGYEVCRPSHPRCAWPEDLFFNDVPLRHVATRAEVRPGRWHFDYPADKIYLGEDPAGQKVEATVTAHAFRGAGVRGVVLRGLVIEKYANPAGQGAVELGERWRIEGNEIRWNHGAGLRLDRGMRVAGNRFHHNGQIGLGGSGPDIVVERNEIAYNNTLGFNHGWEAGGTKFVRTTNLAVRGNWVHHNSGPGLWLDIDNYQWVIEGNRTARNVAAGILIEVSYAGVARFNVVEKDGILAPGEDPSHGTLWYRGGIVVANSPEVEIHGNTVIDGANGIGAVHGERGSGERGALAVRNLYVHDNTIVQTTGVAAGIVTNPPWAARVFGAWNNRFDRNRYHLANPAGRYYAGQEGELTREEWQKRGQDRDSLWIDDAAVSRRFTPGAPVTLAGEAVVRPLPSSAPAGLQPARAVGAVTTVGGPFWWQGGWWWEVDFDRGPDGWVLEKVLYNKK